MIKVEPYECYKEYLAIKRHFTSPSYDYFKYDSMNIRTSKMTFSKRKDNFLFAKLAKTYKNLSKPTKTLKKTCKFLCF